MPLPAFCVATLLLLLLLPRISAAGWFVVLAIIATG
jgi:hypothetical protein